MSITRQSEIAFSLTYLCVLTGDRQHLDLQQTEPGAAVRAPTPAACSCSLWGSGSPLALLAILLPLHLSALLIPLWSSL